MEHHEWNQVLDNIQAETLFLGEKWRFRVQAVSLQQNFDGTFRWQCQENAGCEGNPHECALWEFRRLMPGYRHSKQLDVSILGLRSVNSMVELTCHIPEGGCPWSALRWTLVVMD